MKKKKSLGIMIDLSRNAVMSVSALKIFLGIVRKFGYNTVFLYMEDTYEVEGEDYFGYMRGRYSLEEMKEIDDFCASVGIEAIPCIQTLAHLKTYFKWGQVGVDCGDILLVDDNRTYELISNMFKTLSKCFRSKRIHIGMDEAHMLGRGKYFDKNGQKSSNEIIKGHLEKICSLAKEYEYELFVWSDMFFRPWNEGEYYFNEYKEPPKDAKEALPENVQPVYWDYYSDNQKSYDIMIKMHKKFKNDVWFAGGAWCWAGFAPLNKLSTRLMKKAISSCLENRVNNVMMTMWGDDGAECSRYALLPALCYIAECYKGNFDEDKIKQKFKRVTGIDYDDFIKADLPNLLMGDEPNYCESPCKYMLYSDVFSGFLDYTVSDGVGELYKKYTTELSNVAKKTRKYGYVFKNLESLCSALEIKYELGVKTRNAYKNGDREALVHLAKVEYKELIKRVKAFHDTFEKQWFEENKGYGFEIHDARLGGLCQRLDSCAKRLLAYAKGKIDKIDELEEEILPIPNRKEPKGQPIDYGHYGRIVSAGVLTMSM
ncbi:MAG: beta-N-acetylhexosaminidase, partial [Clostridia bacterium]|nr:beta-N-acetylhexosaminidase [Clostridia bacterium]